MPEQLGSRGHEVVDTLHEGLLEAIDAIPEACEGPERVEESHPL